MLARKSRGKIVYTSLSLALCFVVFSLLLAACGNTAPANEDYTVPVLDGLTALDNVAKDENFRSSVLKNNNGSITGTDVKVFSTTRGIADVQNAFSSEMQKRQWTNATASILKSDALGSSGVVSAYEKLVGGDTNKKHVVGIIILTPEVKNVPLDPYRSSGAIPAGSNVVITVEGALGVGPTPTK